MRYELQRVGEHCGILSMTFSGYAFLGMAVGRVGRRVSSQPAMAKFCQAREYVLRVIYYVTDKVKSILGITHATGNSFVTNTSVLLSL